MARLVELATVYVLTPNSCGNAIVTAYLAEGILPSGDQSCPADPPSAALQAVDALRAHAKGWRGGCGG
jgi:hypothetical protein